MRPALPSQTSNFERVAKQVDQMSAEQRQRIADGHQDDEHFVVREDDFATDDEFTRAVVAEIIKLIGLE